MGAIPPFGLQEQDRTLVMIDGEHFFGCHQSLGFTVDWAKLIAHLQANTNLTAFSYYALVPPDPTAKHAARPAIDWLSYNGGRVYTKPMNEYADIATGRMRLRGTMLAEMAVDMVLAAPRTDHLLLFAGNAELSYPIEKVQQAQCRVTVVSTMMGNETKVSRDIRRTADAFVEVNDLRDLIMRAESMRRDDTVTTGTLRLR